MDDFRRMMEMDGVVPLDARRPSGTPRRQAPPAASNINSGKSTTSSANEAVAIPTAAKQSWASGATARSALNVALQRVNDGDGSGWAIAVLGNGDTRPLPTLQGTARLLSEADRLRARLVLIGSGPNDATAKPFTFVMHPMMGIATLDNDPEDDA